jgi:epoxyqueuosine reductase
MKLTAAEVKAFAVEAGADVVGVGSIDRWAGAPLQQDPRQIMPEAKSVIAMAFRVMRGSLRGIEEGTFFSNYSAMGYGGLTYLYMPMAVINIAKMIEDRGHEAITITSWHTSRRPRPRSYWPASFPTPAGTTCGSL